MLYFWWGWRGNLTLITLGSERANHNPTSNRVSKRRTTTVRLVFDINSGILVENQNPRLGQSDFEEPGPVSKSGHCFHRAKRRPFPQGSWQSVPPPFVSQLSAMVYDSYVKMGKNGRAIPSPSSVEAYQRYVSKNYQWRRYDKRHTQKTQRDVQSRRDTSSLASETVLIKKKVPWLYWPLLLGRRFFFIVFVLFGDAIVIDRKSCADPTEARRIVFPKSFWNSGNMHTNRSFAKLGRSAGELGRNGALPSSPIPRPSLTRFTFHHGLFFLSTIWEPGPG